MDEKNPSNIFIQGISPGIPDVQAMEKSFHIYSEYVTTWKDWVSQDSLTKIHGVDTFDFAYFTNGILEAIEKVFLCQFNTFKRLILVEGEVGFFKWFAEKLLIKYQTIKDPLKFNFHKEDLFCWSQPFSQDGMIHEYYDDIIKNVKKSNATLFLDMAYFATHKIQLDISFADYAAFSLSKPFGISGLRAGILFSKHLNPFLSLRKETGNAGTFQMNQSIQLMKRFKTSYNYFQNADKYKKLGQAHNLDQTDTYCFYTTRNTKHKFFQNQFIRKGEHIARIPLKWLLYRSCGDFPVSGSDDRKLCFNNLPPANQNSRSSGPPDDLNHEFHQIYRSCLSFPVSGIYDSPLRHSRGSGNPVDQNPEVSNKTGIKPV